MKQFEEADVKIILLNNDVITDSSFSEADDEVDG